MTTTTTTTTERSSSTDHHRRQRGFALGESAVPQLSRPTRRPRLPRPHRRRRRGTHRPPPRPGRDADPIAPPTNPAGLNEVRFGIGRSGGTGRDAAGREDGRTHHVGRERWSGGRDGPTARETARGRAVPGGTARAEPPLGRARVFGHGPARGEGREPRAGPAPRENGGKEGRHPGTTGPPGKQRTGIPPPTDTPGRSRAQSPGRRPNHGRDTHSRSPRHTSGSDPDARSTAPRPPGAQRTTAPTTASRPPAPPRGGGEARRTSPKRLREPTRGAANTILSSFSGHYLFERRQAGPRDTQDGTVRSTRGPPAPRAGTPRERHTLGRAPRRNPVPERGHPHREAAKATLRTPPPVCSTHTRVGKRTATLLPHRNPPAGNARLPWGVWRAGRARGGPGPEPRQPARHPDAGTPARPGGTLPRLGRGEARATVGKERTRNAKAPPGTAGA